MPTLLTAIQGPVIRRMAWRFDVANCFTKPCTSTAYANIGPQVVECGILRLCNVPPPPSPTPHIFSCSPITFAPTFYLCSNGGPPTPNRCTAGFYCPSTAMPEQACPDGYYSVAGASSCTECPAGFSCASTASTPVACDPGSFAIAASSNCTSCAPGFYCPSTDSTLAYECPLGTYSIGGASSCMPCTQGFYCPFTNAAVEIACPDGYYAAGSAGNCTGCPAGFACSADGSSLLACDPGYYSQAGVTDCVSCPEGYHCPYTDQVRLVVAELCVNLYANTVIDKHKGSECCAVAPKHSE